MDSDTAVHYVMEHFFEDISVDHLRSSANSTEVISSRISRVFSLVMLDLGEN